MTDQPRPLDYNEAARQRNNLLDRFRTHDFVSDYAVYHLWCTTFPLLESNIELKPEASRAITDFYEEHLKRNSQNTLMHNVTIDIQIAEAGLKLAEPYFVPADIGEPILASSMNLDDHRWHPSDFPTESGFVWFENPMLAGSLPVQGISWITTHFDKEQFAIVVYGPFKRENRQVVMMPLYVLNQFYGRWRTVEELQDDINLLRHEYMHDLEDDFPNGLLAPSLYACTQGLAALLVFMNQKIVVTTDEKPNRTERKRGERSGYPSERVQVVHLRRVQRPKKDAHLGQHAPADHDHSWLVKGFWRQQKWGPRWCYTRTVYVAPHIRGPKDKPLKANTRIFTVSR